jgi:hypothetical protein
MRNLLGLIFPATIFLAGLASVLEMTDTASAIYPVYRPPTYYSCVFPYSTYPNPGTNYCSYPYSPYPYPYPNPYPYPYPYPNPYVMR